MGEKWGKRSNFVLFVVGSDFIVSELLVVTWWWGRKSCLGLADIISFVFWIYSRIGDAG